MTMKPSVRRLLFAALLGFASASSIAADTTAAETEKQVSGLWYYTGLTTSGGEDMPLTGVFLFKDGIFVQQAIFDDHPFETARSMSHAGPYQAFADHVHLIAEQTISTTPGESEPLSFRVATEHDVTAAGDGDGLRLVFSMGTGTIQDFEYVGPGEGELYSLGDGALAFVDGHFVLVKGNADEIVTGYGTYEKHADDQLLLKVIRWTEGGTDGVTNLRDVELKARFDGKSLTLPDGRRIDVVE